MEVDENHCTCESNKKNVVRLMYKNVGITFSSHHKSAIEASSAKYNIIFTLRKFSTVL